MPTYALGNGGWRLALDAKEEINARVRKIPRSTLKGWPTGVSGTKSDPRTKMGAIHCPSSDN